MRDLSEWNALRYEPTLGRGHVERYALSACSPCGNQAFWLQASILSPVHRAADAIAEGWAAFFHRDRPPVVVKQTLRFQHATFSKNGLSINMGDVFQLSAQRTQGQLSFGSNICWSLGLRATGEPLVYLPLAPLYEAAFPRSKMVCPAPSLSVSGTLSVDGQKLSVDAWRGMQCHHWGQEYPGTYRWGACNQWDRPSELIVHAASVSDNRKNPERIRGTLVCVRHEGIDYSFNRLRDWFRTESSVSSRGFRVAARRDDMEFEFEAEADGAELVSLYYPSSDGSITYSSSSRLARARFRLKTRAKTVEACSRCCSLEIGTTVPLDGVELRG